VDNAQLDIDADEVSWGYSAFSIQIASVRHKCSAKWDICNSFSALKRVENCH